MGKRLLNTGPLNVIVKVDALISSTRDTFAANAHAHQRLLSEAVKQLDERCDTNACGHARIESIVDMDYLHAEHRVRAGMKCDRAVGGCPHEVTARVKWDEIDLYDPLTLKGQQTAAKWFEDQYMTKPTKEPAEPADPDVPENSVGAW